LMLELLTELTKLLQLLTTPTISIDQEIKDALQQ
jgi:hypothetical protein